MSILNLFFINLTTSQPNFCDNLPKYGMPNRFEKSVFLFLFDGLSLITASNFLRQLLKNASDIHWVKRYAVGFQFLDCAKSTLNKLI